VVPSGEDEVGMKRMNLTKGVMSYENLLGFLEGIGRTIKVSNREEDDG
jgi:hypothetical protein